MVKEQGGDPSVQYLTLLEVAELIRDGSAGPDPAGKAYELVKEAAEQLMAEHGDYVRADLNTADVAAGIGSEQESAAFRTAYHDSVLASDSLADTLQHLLKVVSAGDGKDLDKVLDTMKVALGADLAAARPSTESVRLQYLVSDLYHLKVISTVIDQCDKLGQTLQKRHGLPPFKASELASDLVAVSNERWVDASRMGRLADRYGAQKDPSCKVDFLSGARESLRQMPPQVFSAPENRQSLLDAAQTAIDDAIDQEMSE
jgi:type III secretion protein W